MLTEVLQQDRQDREQVRFQELLLHLRDGDVCFAVLELLMTCCHSQVDSAAFDDALHLHPTIQAVAKYKLPSFVTQESLLPPSKLFTLVPLSAKHH